MYALVLRDLHESWAWFVVIGNGLAGVWAVPALATWLPAQVFG